MSPQGLCKLDKDTGGEQNAELHFVRSVVARIRPTITANQEWRSTNKEKLDKMILANTVALFHNRPVKRRRSSALMRHVMDTLRKNVDSRKKGGE